MSTRARWVTDYKSRGKALSSWGLASQHGPTRLWRWLRGWPPQHGGMGLPRATELAIANARLLLAVAALATVFLDPAEPQRFPAIAYGLLWTYAGFAVAVRLVLYRSTPPLRQQVGIHGVDVIVPCVLIVFTEGPSSPFFTLLPLALLGAAYRWGLPATVLTGAVGLLVLALDAVVVWARIGPEVLHGTPLDGTRLMLRAMYLVVLTAMIGYLAERHRQLTAEASIMADLLRYARSRVGVRELLAGMGGRLMELYGARGLALAVTDHISGRTALWELQDGVLRDRLIPASEAERYIAPPDPAAAARSMQSEGPTFGPNVRAYVSCEVPLPERVQSRLYLLDPEECPLSHGRLTMLQRLVAFAGPAVINAYFLHRLRSRALAREREKLARELHDGIVQSLIGAEMQVESLRRVLPVDDRVAKDLGAVRDNLRECVLEVRGMMERMHAASMSPSSLGEAVQLMVIRLHRETGIEVSVNGLDLLTGCTTREAREIAGIIQEALTNVRKHSGARHVQISYTSNGADARLVVEDDGRGFPCPAGPGDLERSAHAPRVLASRAKSLGGRLAVEAPDGGGARLVISWPLARSLADA